MKTKLFFLILAAIIENGLFVYSILFWGWRVSHIAFIYWFETLVITIFTLLKLKKMGYKKAISTVAFFMTIFLVISLIFIFIKIWGMDESFTIDTISKIPIVLVVIFLNHLFFHVVHFLGEKVYEKNLPPGEIYGPATGRGGFMILLVWLSMIFGSFLIFFVVLKAIGDILARLIQAEVFKPKKNRLVPNP